MNTVVHLRARGDAEARIEAVADRLGRAVVQAVRGWRPSIG